MSNYGGLFICAAASPSSSCWATATIKYNRQASQRSLLWRRGALKGAFCSLNVLACVGGIPTLTSPLVGQQLVAFFAAALEAAHRIPTHVIAPAVVEAALVNIFKTEMKPYQVNCTAKSTHARTHAQRNHLGVRSSRKRH